MTSDQTLQLILGFISSLVSGAVAGLIAGLVILQSQFGRQLALDDQTKLLDVLHSLEKMSNKIRGALGWQHVGLTRDKLPLDIAERMRFNEAEAKQRIERACLDVLVELDELPPRLGYLRSRKYECIKNYLISRIGTERLESFDPKQMMENIQEILEGVQYYFDHYYGFANHLRLIWQAMVILITGNALTVKEKTLLAEAARRKGKLSQQETVGSDSHSPGTVKGNISVNIPGVIEVGPEEVGTKDQRYVAALTRLQQHALIHQVGRSSTREDNVHFDRGVQTTFTDFVLTRDGWWAGLKYAENKEFTLPNVAGGRSQPDDDDDG